MEFGFDSALGIPARTTNELAALTFPFRKINYGQWDYFSYIRASIVVQQRDQ